MADKEDLDCQSRAISLAVNSFDLLFNFLFKWSNSSFVYVLYTLVLKQKNMAYSSIKKGSSNPEPSSLQKPSKSLLRKVSGGVGRNW